MFPLGGVLFPSLGLPLHVFEPRYRMMVDHCLEADLQFGVVLIQRGSEVGGGDVRSDVGTVAQITEAARLEDGRWALGTIGVRRIRVLEWLPDDPYPRAVVEDWPEPVAEDALDASYAEALTLFRRVAALTAELGEPTVPATIELADDPVLGSYQIAAVGTFGPSDQQMLLSVPGAKARLEALVRMLAEEADYLAQRLALG